MVCAMRILLLLCFLTTACGHKAPATTTATPASSTVKPDDKKADDKDKDGKDSKVDEAAQDGDGADDHDIYAGTKNQPIKK
jgi:hypothetical protein